MSATDFTKRHPTKLEMAYVLFMDIVGYSKLPMDHQEAQLGTLQAVVSATSEFLQAYARKEMISLPTGDGMALVFFGDAEAAARCALEISRDLKSHPEVLLRMGLHSGPVYRVADINANQNVAGGGINIAQRVMDCGDAGHILASQSVAEVLGQLSSWKDGLHDLGEAEVKHGVRLHLYNFYTNSTGNPSLPGKIRIQQAALRPASKMADEQSSFVSTGRRRTIYLLTMASIVLLLVVLAASFQFYHFSWQKLFGPKIPQQKNLVVLPFTAVDGRPEEQIYCDGLTETVTAKIAHVPTLQVPSALDVRDHRVNSTEKARNQFGANLVLAASWQRAENSVRINLSLVDAKTGKQLRTETITAPATDLFRLQDQVVLTAARMLELQLPANSASSLTSHGTNVLSAYDFYLQGVAYLQRFERPENVETAINFFSRSTQADPTYAQAQAGLAQAYWYKYNATKDPQWAEKAKAAVRAARNLNSQLPEVQLAIGLLNLQTGDYPGAVSEFQRVLESDPQNVDAYMNLGSAYDTLGRVDEAEQQFRKAAAISPRCWKCYNSLGIFLNRHARYREAAEAWQQIIELTPDNVWGYLNVGVAYFNIGQFEKADGFFRKGLQVAPDNADLYANLGTVNFFLGRFDEDTAYCKKAIERNPARFDYWGNLGDAYRMIPEQSNKAPDAYREAIRLAEAQLKVNPSDNYALSSLAHYYSRTNDIAKAQKYLDEAVKGSPEDVDTLLIACLIYLESGERKAALSWLRKAVLAGYPREHLAANAELKDLHSDPEFNILKTEAKSYF